MSSRTTWFWLFAAAALFAVIYFFPAHPNRPPAYLLPSFKPSDVSSIQVLPSGHRLEIRAERTNDSWVLTRPIAYPAQSDVIANLLSAFERLLPNSRINEAQLTNRFNADEDFGFSDPQFTLIFKQNDSFVRIRIGKLTPPGDEVFLQVVGIEGVIYVVSSDILKLIPHSGDEWRDTVFLNLQNLAFDRIAVTNGARAFVLQRESPGLPWSMVYPMPARANNSKIKAALDQLSSLRVLRFISDDSKPDSDALGLQPPELELAFATGSNTVARLQLGKSPTNAAQTVYARRVGLSSMVTIPKEPFTVWRFSSVNEFRDPNLITLTRPLASVEVCANDHFSLDSDPTGKWHISPGDFPVDSDVVSNFISALSRIQIVDFVKDSVLEKALPNYGLASPARECLFHFKIPDSVEKATAPATSAGSGFPSTNGSAVKLNFSIPGEDGRLFARRSDETSVYSITAEDLAPLPLGSWQLRERKLWDFALDDLDQVVVRVDGKMREFVRRGQYQWSLGPHSQGFIEPLAVEETLRGLLSLSVGNWLPPGRDTIERCGLTNHTRQLTFQLKSGASYSLEFGGEAPDGLPFGAVPRVDGQTWLFQWPHDHASISLWRDMVNYLSP